jgi:uncharacterized protein YcfJ
MAVIAVNVCSCSSLNNAGKGFALGAATGAGSGALVGNGKTSLIGAAVGGVIGGTVGFFMDIDENDKAMIEVEKSKVNRGEGQPQDQEYVEVKRQKVVTYKQKVAVQKEHKRYYIDPKTGKKIYLK